jgi:phosphoribosylanthranilate isomerase
MTHVKICRVRNPGLMPPLAQAGVRFVGIHLIQNVAAEKIEGATRLCRAAEESGLEPVILTKVMDIESIGELIRRTRTKWLQLHAPWPLDLLQLLRERFPPDRLSLLQLVPAGVSTDGCYIERAAAIADYLILDHAEGGTGRTVGRSVLLDLMRHVPAARTFVAGGLTPENVRDVVKSHNPFAVDVQSGVLGPHGDQDVGLVIRFVRAVKNATGAST